MIRILAVVCSLLVGVGCFSLLNAGEYNSTMNIGDAAPEWKDLPGVDEKKHSLADLKDKPMVVVVFTCNSCPVANDYEERINEFAKKYAETVAVVAINVNNVPADSFPRMQERAKSKKYEYPYLHDPSQKIAKAYGAAFTPEFFLLNKERKVVYMGGLDDNSDTKFIKMRHLEAAVEAVKKGEKPPVAESVAIGCRIRYAPERKKK